MHIIQAKTLPLQTEFGKMPEWPNGTVSKTVVRVTVPRVRIPLFPLEEKQKKECKSFNLHSFLFQIDISTAFSLSLVIPHELHFAHIARLGLWNLVRITESNGIQQSVS